MDYSNQQQYANEAMYVPSTRAEAQGNSTDLIGPSGHRYAQPRNDRSSQLQLVLANFAASYFQNGGDMGNAMGAAASALQDYDNRAYRASQAAQLEAQGYSPVGIMAWIDSGDAKDLMTGMGSRKVNGIMMTGEQAQAAENAAQKKLEYEEGKTLITSKDQATLDIQKQNAATSAGNLAETRRHNQAMESIQQANQSTAQQLKQTEAIQALQTGARKSYDAAQQTIDITGKLGAVGTDGKFKLTEDAASLFNFNGIGGPVGSGAHYADAAFNQLASKEFMNAIDGISMSGLTDYEGNKMTNARNALMNKDGTLNTKLSREQVEKELGTIYELAQTGQARAKWIAENNRQPTFKEDQEIKNSVKNSGYSFNRSAVVINR